MVLYVLLLHHEIVIEIAKLLKGQDKDLATKPMELTLVYAIAVFSLSACLFLYYYRKDE